MDLLTIGETMVLLSADGYGQLEYSKSFHKSIGGAESNTAIGLSRLGKQVAWISKVGNDPFGQEIVKTLRGEGIDVTKAIVDPMLRTGLMIKEFRTPSNVHVYYYRQHSAASSLDESDIQEEWIEQVKRVHLTGITLALGDGPRRAVHKLLRLCQHYKVPVSFDVNMRLKLWSAAEAKAELEKVYPYITTLFVGDDEALLCTQTEDIEQAIQYFISHSSPLLQRIIVKQGAKGVLGIEGTERIFLPALSNIEVVDTIGAGDGFNAGYLYAELEGFSFVEALRLGNWVGAQVVTQKGDYQGLPTWGDYQAYLHQMKTIER